MLLKIQTHYVEQPAWQDLVARGTADLQTALAEPIFVQRNLPGVNAAAIEGFRRELAETEAGRSVASRNDARDIAVAAANLAQQRLGLAPTIVILEYLCGADELTGSLFHVPHARSVKRSLLADRRQLRRAGCRIEGSGRRPRDRSRHTWQPRGASRRAGRRSHHRRRRSPDEPLHHRPGRQLAARPGRLRLHARGRRAGRGRAPKSPSAVSGSKCPASIRCKSRIRNTAWDTCGLTCFQKTTRRDLEAALWKLNREGMRSLIIDLRGNPGGLLISSVDIADLFLTQGVIVSTHGRIAQEDSTYMAHEEGTWSVPLTVIIDQEARCRRDFFRRNPRPPPRHGCRRAELRQRLRAGHLPA